jgi:hypothetical protein
MGINIFYSTKLIFAILITDLLGVQAKILELSLVSLKDCGSSFLGHEAGCFDQVLIVFIAEWLTKIISSTNNMTAFTVELVVVETGFLVL